jgi:hypothetical protein
MRLRGEVGRLRMDLRELEQVKTNAPMSRNEMLASIASFYSERVSQLKQLLETNPSEKIPELQFLTDRDWLWLAAQKVPDTEDGYTSTRFIGAVSVVSDSSSQEYRMQLNRMADADGKLGDVRDLSSAFRRYAREHQGEFPTNFDQAAPYFYEIQAQRNERYEQLRKK